MFGDPHPYLYVRGGPIAHIDALGLACGSGKSEVIPDLWFKDCCKQHDKCYDGDGCAPMPLTVSDTPPKLPPTKEECDGRFLDCMMQKCSKFGIAGMRIACEGYAADYHWAVARFGYGPFERARAEQNAAFGKNLNMQPLAVWRMRP